MNRNFFRDNLSNVLKECRESSGITQKEMANRLGVGERTIQNWESGYSEPLASQLKEWFEALSVQPQPYLIQLLYQDELKLDDEIFTDSNIDTALTALLSSMSMHTKKELLYLFYGSHGSSPECVIHMVTAHLHTPLRNRINVSEQIITNYEIADAKGEIIEPDYIRPNMVMLNEATQRARKSIINNKDSYNTI